MSGENAVVHAEIGMMNSEIGVHDLSLGNSGRAGRSPHCGLLEATERLTIPVYRVADTERRTTERGAQWKAAGLRHS